MKKTNTIVYVAIAIIALLVVGCIIFLPMLDDMDTDNSSSEAESSIVISEDSTEIAVPSDESIEDSDIDETSAESGDATVEEASTEDINDKTPEESEEESQPSDKVDGDIKDEDTTKPPAEDDESDFTYIPPTEDGEDNPFDNDNSTIINDRPADDFVSDGEPGPGEGVHF